MQAEIEGSDKRFGRTLFFINFGWLMISLFTLTYSAVETFIAHPEYLHQWQGLTICVLIILILTFFGRLILSGWKKRPGREWTWPPPWRRSILHWLGIYLPVTLLTIINTNFVLGYFIVMGMTFSLFAPKLVITLASLIFLSFIWFLGYITWPLTGSDLGDILGNSITFISLIIVCITIQNLIGERFERTHLLQQLAHTNGELAEAHRQLEETAAQEQELAVLRERTRLAREMHDTLGYALVLVSVKLEAAQRLRERDPLRCEQELEATKEIVRTSMQELRASIANLRSPALEREPACRALSRYAREMAQRANLRVSYDLHPAIEGLPELVEETLWKVGQEALANIEKHAHAQNVLLHISRNESQIFLRIEDDGVGLPNDLCQTHTEGEVDYSSPAGHYGLKGMQERVKNIQGQLTIRPHDEHGTNIEVILPLVEAPLLTI